MYFGSVRFYKHVILLLIAILIVASTSAAIYLSAKSRSLEKENSRLEQDLILLDTLKRAPYYTNSFSYQTLFPDLNTNCDFKFEKDKPQSVYLTFDDGPSHITNEILDILFERHIRATFFVLYKEGEEANSLYRRMIAEGHTIALHSTTHNYDKIYSSMENFLTDVEYVSARVYDATGYKPKIYRFPGGSVNPHNASIYRQATSELLRRGYVYYDWNVSADDAISGTSKNQMILNILNGVHAHNKSIVLLHDSASKANTVSILPAVLDTLISEGYNFYPLSNKVRPITFDYEKTDFTIKE
ncbi:MAG: polysaccharide deacetylase family protein [Eubacteriales bacterium]